MISNADIRFSKCIEAQRKEETWSWRGVLCSLQLRFFTCAATPPLVQIPRIGSGVAAKAILFLHPSREAVLAGDSAQKVKVIGRDHRSGSEKGVFSKKVFSEKSILKRDSR